MTESNPPRPLRAAGRTAAEGIDGLTQIAVRAVASIKARDIVVLDVTGRTSYTDVLVLCTGTSSRQVRAIANRVVSSHKDAGRGRPMGVEGLEAGRWVLVDLGDVIVHVFEEVSRDTYDLDGLWVDARQIPMEELGLTPHGLLPGESQAADERSLLAPDEDDDWDDEDEDEDDAESAIDPDLADINPADYADLDGIDEDDLNDADLDDADLDEGEDAGDDDTDAGARA